MQNSLESLFCFSATVMYYSMLCLLGILFWKYSGEGDNNASQVIRLENDGDNLSQSHLLQAKEERAWEGEIFRNFVQSCLCVGDVGGQTW